MPPELATQLAGTAVGLFQAGVNAIKEKKLAKKADRIFAQREGDLYKTPQEVFDILGLSEMQASQGLSDQAMEYITGASGAGLANNLSVIQQVGGDPNDAAAAIDKFYGNIFNAGYQSDLLKMQNFDKVTNALNLVAANKDAEWQARDNIRKDELQTLNARIAATNAGQQSGLNLATAGAANAAAAYLYPKDKPVTIPGATPASTGVVRGTDRAGMAWDLPVVDPTLGQPGATPSEILRRQRGIIID